MGAPLEPDQGQVQPLWWSIRKSLGSRWRGTDHSELSMSSTSMSTSTSHSFIPPGPSDLRSPCPALNALANHGYMYAAVA